MPFDFKKEYKEFYMPKNKPEIVTVPPANYIAVRGTGDPNEPDGAYQQAISVLYAIAYTLKMSYKTDHRIEGFFEYVVPPLEGFWWQENTDSINYADKSAFHWVSVIRLPDFITPVEKETLFRESDVLSLHCPLTATTKGFVNAETLEWMKPTAILINTGRGPLIDEQAVADALNSGSLSAAGVDVLSTEPPTANNPLLTAKNCHFTPHIAWATKEARIRLMDIAINNLKAYQNGKPIHVV